VQARNACKSATPRAGFEPAAYSLGGSRSIRLSYRGRVRVYGSAKPLPSSLPPWPGAPRTGLRADCAHSCPIESGFELFQVASREALAPFDGLRVDLHRERRLGVSELLGDVDRVVPERKPQAGGGAPQRVRGDSVADRFDLQFAQPGVGALDRRLQAPSDVALARRNGSASSGDGGEEWGDFRYQPDQMIDLGDRILLLGRMIGSGPSSGVGVDSEWADLCMLANGQVIREQVFFDRVEALTAAGLAE
jgi:hypothetical protein